MNREKRGGFELIILIAIIFLLFSFVKADYTYEGFNWTRSQYLPSETLQGKLYMSFNNESSNEFFNFLIKDKNSKTIISKILFINDF